MHRLTVFILFLISLRAAAHAAGSTPIDGKWKVVAGGVMAIKGRTPPAVVYTFARGRGTFEKDGKSKGDGFSYRTEGNKLFVTGGKEEGLSGTGTGRGQPHHLTYEVTRKSMRWYMAHPGSPDNRRLMYEFAKE